PEGPAIVKDVELTVVPSGAAVGTASSLGIANAAQPPSPTPLVDELVHTVVLTNAHDGGSSAASGMFTIAFADSTNARHARALVEELKGAGHAAYLDATLSSRKVPYRVRVGYYSSAA